MLDLGLLGTQLGFRGKSLAGAGGSAVPKYGYLLFHLLGLVGLHAAGLLEPSSSETENQHGPVYFLALPGPEFPERADLKC